MPSLSGESKALLALHSLPDDYRVYHRKTWYSFDGGVREGETDLLLLHPELGMLVLQVKGGRVAFDGRAGTWTSTGRDGMVHEIKDPFAQAQRNVKALAAKAAALTVEGQAMPEFVHGHGVVVPACDDAPGADPVRAPRELVIDARDLAGDVTARVEALFRAWGKGRPAAPLTKKWIAARSASSRRTSRMLALGSALRWEEKGGGGEARRDVGRARGGRGPGREGGRTDGARRRSPSWAG